MDQQQCELKKNPQNVCPFSVNFSWKRKKKQEEGLEGMHEGLNLKSEEFVMITEIEK